MSDKSKLGLARVIIGRLRCIGMAGANDPEVKRLVRTMTRQRLEELAALAVDHEDDNVRNKSLVDSLTVYV